MSTVLSPSTLEENRPLFQAYLSGLPSVYDNYLEDHILDSRFYSIRLGGVSAGYCAVHGGELLTGFYLPTGALRRAQDIFREVLRELHIRFAYVPTCDEQMLSICLDFHTRVELQAYIFRCGDAAVRPAEFPRALLRRTEPAEWPEIERRTDGFFDMLYYRWKRGPGFLYEIYELADGKRVLGYGLRESGRIFPEYHAIGMYILPEHRGRNAGRSILLHLRDICREQGVRPLPACWYHNHASRRTLESAGFVAGARLLKIHFA